MPPGMEPAIVVPLAAKTRLLVAHRWSHDTRLRLTRRGLEMRERERERDPNVSDRNSHIRTCGIISARRERRDRIASIRYSYLVVELRRVLGV